MSQDRRASGAIQVRKGPVVFTNDSQASGCDHNIYIDHIKLSTGATISSSDTAHVLRDRMNTSELASAFDGVDVMAASAAIPWNGGLRFFVGASGSVARLSGPSSPPGTGLRCARC